METGGQTLELRVVAYWLIVAGLIGWTALCLGEGWWIAHVIRTDMTGEHTAAMLRASGDAIDAATAQQMIAAPATRNSYVSSFIAAMWAARFQIWLWPTLGFGILALLVRPRRA